MRTPAWSMGYTVPMRNPFARRPAASKPDPAGRTELMLACCAPWTSRDIERIQDLLEAGADPNAVDAQGNTAMHHALSAESPTTLRHWSAVMVLGHAGADPTVANHVGKTPLDLAMDYMMPRGLDGYKTGVAFLLDHGADLLRPNPGGQCAADVILGKGPRFFGEELVARAHEAKLGATLPAAHAAASLAPRL